MRKLWIVPLLALAFFCFGQEAKAADPKWTFSIPVRLNNLLPGAHKAEVVAQVSDAQGAPLASGLYEENIENGKMDKVVTLELPLLAGRDASTAVKYTVWLWIDGNKTPDYNHADPAYRAKAGTELVYLIQQPLPLSAPGTGQVGADTVAP